MLGRKEVSAPALVIAYRDVFDRAFIQRDVICNEVNGERAVGPEFGLKAEVGQPYVVKQVAVGNQNADFVS